MKKEIEKISIEKEGIYYTLYINEIAVSAGYLEDLIDALEEEEKDDLNIFFEEYH